MDKLNINADISLGDNYTGVDDSELGSNTVIIRTDRGMAAFNNLNYDIEYNDINIEKIADAQGLRKRKNNIEYAQYKQNKIELETGTAIDINSMRKTGTGALSMKKYTFWSCQI